MPRKYTPAAAASQRAERKKEAAQVANPHISHAISPIYIHFFGDPRLASITFMAL